ncbi:DUF2382 domain-containing protein [Acetobacteraceae bacterium]|nr:DUF2382 domain-containing protein [Acetobacteraceae bacterium]
MTDDLLTLPSDIEILRLHAEKLEVGKRVRETGRVTVSTVTHTRDQLVEELVSNERVEIEHLVIDRMVDEMPAVREEGDTIIIPIVEEVVVVERRLMLRKEVRITRVRSTHHYHEVVQLRSQEAVVSRTAADVPTDHVQVKPKEDHDA